MRLYHMTHYQAQCTLMQYVAKIKVYSVNNFCS